MAINYETSKREVIESMIQDKEYEIQSLIRDFEEMRLDIARLMVEKELDEAKKFHNPESTKYVELCLELNQKLSKHEQMQEKNNLKIDALKEEQEILNSMLK